MPFKFRLELASGEPADPPRFETSTPNWRPGDVLYVGRDRLRVLEVREDVLVVERE